MSTAELKAIIIEEVSKTEDEHLLDDVLKLIRFEKNISKPYILSDKELLMVREAEQDVESGNYLTEEEAEEDIKKWLGK